LVKIETKQDCERNDSRQECRDCDYPGHRECSRIKAFIFARDEGVAPIIFVPLTENSVRAAEEALDADLAGKELARAGARTSGTCGT
jgi:hypothetical protein